MLKPMIGLSLCILVVQALCMAGDVTPSTVTAANKRVEGFHIKAFGVQEALRDIAQKQDLAIGVDAVLTERENKVVLDFPGGTVTDLLNMFVAQSPGYRWRQDGGIIHVFRKDAYLSLANVVLSYPGAQHRTRLQMWMDIHDRPEVKAWMKSTQCRPGGESFHAKNFKPHKGPISIEPGSMTVAHFLDEVALQSGVNYWAIQQRFSPASHSCHVSVILW